MTGRIRKLRPFWSDVVRSTYPEHLVQRVEDLEAETARQVAENARLRDALAAERNHSARLTSDTAEAVKGALELRATIRRLEGELQTAREQAAVHGAIVLRLRAVLKADPSQDRRNCVALTDRLIEAYRAVHRLEIELGRAQGRDMAPDWHPASQAIVGGLM